MPSPPVSEKAVEVAWMAARRMTERAIKPKFDVIEAALEAAAPILYAEWRERFVAEGGLVFHQHQEEIVRSGVDAFRKGLWREVEPLLDALDGKVLSGWDEGELERLRALLNPEQGDE